jgi:hypothetical protein
MGQPAGLGMVSRILQAAILLHRRGVGQRHPVVGRHQPVNEPVPVSGRRHHHAGAVGLIRGSLCQNRGQMMGEASVIDHLLLLIEYYDHTVVCMQITPAVAWHRRLLLSLEGCSSPVPPDCSA